MIEEFLATLALFAWLGAVVGGVWLLVRVLREPTPYQRAALHAAQRSREWTERPTGQTLQQVLDELHIQ